MIRRIWGWLRRRVAAVPLTEVGWAVAAAMVLSFFLGWLLGWDELNIVAWGSLVALAVGVLFVIRRYHFEMTRVIDPGKVVVGEPSFGSLTVKNPGVAPSMPLRAEDKVGNQIVPVDLPPLGPGKSHSTMYELPTDRRGVVEVGPVVIARSDPLRLFRSEVRHTDVDVLWIHPRHHILNALPVGFAKDFEGPTSESTPKGDVTFHALREYVHGDDYRHIHWKSTARLGDLMVREYVDNRQPQTTVVIDPSVEAYANGDFEVAVEVAASVGVSSLYANQPVNLFFGKELVAGTVLASTPDSLLDQMSLIEAEPGPADPGIVGSAFQRAQATSLLVYITGGVTPEELMVRLAPVRRKARIVVVRCWPTAPEFFGSIPGAKLVDIVESKEFKAVWDRMAS